MLLASHLTSVRPQTEEQGLMERNLATGLQELPMDVRNRKFQGVSSVWRNSEHSALAVDGKAEANPMVLGGPH